MKREQGFVGRNWDKFKEKLNDDQGSSSLPDSLKLSLGLFLGVPFLQISLHTEIIWGTKWGERHTLSPLHLLGGFCPHQLLWLPQCCGISRENYGSAGDPGRIVLSVQTQSLSNTEEQQSSKN